MGMKGKRHSRETLDKFKTRIAWNKGLTKETDERVRKYGKSVAKSWNRPERQIHKKVAGDILRDARDKYIREHPEHQAHAARCARQKMAGLGYISKQQMRLFQVVKKVYPEAMAEYPVPYGGRGRTKFLDVAIPNLKLDFEYDGLYWHNQDSDNERDAILIELGWKIIRIDKEALEIIEEEGMGAYCCCG